MAKRSDTVVVLAGGNGRGQGVSDTGEPLIVVVCHHILEPEQMVWLDSTANVNRLIDRPELVDIAHQIDILADALTQHADALDFAVYRRLGAHLRLHLLKTHLHQTRTSLGQIRRGGRSPPGT